MNRILIISSEFQPDIDDVISWLIHYNIDFIRITPSTNLNILNLKIINDKKIDINIVINNLIYNINEFSGCLLYYNSLPNPFIEHIKIESHLDHAVYNYIERDWNTLALFILNYIYHNIFTIGTYLMPNKLDQLKFATEVGLNIPYTEIRNNFNYKKLLKDNLIGLAPYC